MSFDSLLPPEMAVRAEQVGVRKAQLNVVSMFMLAVLAGAFIALGAIFATTVMAGASAMLPYGVIRLLAGSVFSLGLILVVVAGAELFTGNNLIVMAWASRKISTRLLVKNWLVVYSGNFVGSLATAGVMYLTGQFAFGNGSVGLAALTTADSKTKLDFIQAIALGIMCNSLVCLAVWLSYSARSAVDRVVTIIPPIAAFVTSGFEHSIANMYFIPIGLLIKTAAPASFWTSIGKTAADYPTLTWDRFFLGNLLPVTIGNIIGGSIMVGLVYWFVYLRPKPAS